MPNLFALATLAGMWMPRRRPSYFFRQHRGQFAVLILALAVLSAIVLGVAPALALYSPPSWYALMWAAASFAAGVATIYWW